MAHHQGLILLSINNFLNNNILIERFNRNPEIEAVDVLLQERMPADVIITKENKEKVGKLKYKDYENYSEKTFNKVNKNINNINVISNNEYTIVLSDKGTGYSKYKDILVNRFKETEDTEQGIFFYVKNIKQKRIWANSHMNYLGPADKYTVTFSPDSSKITRIDGNIETTTKVTVCSGDNVEIRSLEITNIGNLEEILEVTSFLEPVLSSKEADISHPAFNNLFLRYEYLEDMNAILVRRRDRHSTNQEIYMVVFLDTESDNIGELEYEIDKEKFMGRGNINIPKMVAESKPLSKTMGLVTDPAIVLKRNIKLNPEQKVILDLVICVSEDREEVLDLAKKYKNIGEAIRAFSLSKSRAEIETRYIGIKGIEVETYQRMLRYLLFQNPLKKLYVGSGLDQTAERSKSNCGLFRTTITVLEIRNLRRFANHSTKNTRHK